MVIYYMGWLIRGLKTFDYEGETLICCYMKLNRQEVFRGAFEVIFAENEPFLRYLHL